MIGCNINRKGTHCSGKLQAKGGVVKEYYKFIMC